MSSETDRPNPVGLSADNRRWDVGGQLVASKTASGCVWMGMGMVEWI